jgi:hypothetical protein
MTQRKPDRYERVARRLFRAEEKLPWAWNEARATHQVATLLRQEHEWLRRMVKAALKDVAQVKRIVGKHDDHVRGMKDGLEVILNQLTQRRK